MTLRQTGVTVILGRRGQRPIGIACALLIVTGCGGGAGGRESSAPGDTRVGATKQSWTRVVSPVGLPSGSEFAGVAAISPDDVWAVGDQFNQGSTLVEHWNGHDWTHVPSPDPSRTGRGDNSHLVAVAAAAASDIWAVGTHTSGVPSVVTHGLIEHWTGSAWTIVPTPQVGKSSGLLGVTTVDARDAWAVGWYGSTTQRALVVHWDGSRWTVMKVPEPGVFDGLSGVTAISASDVWAVGNYNQRQGLPPTPLALHWNGSVWKEVRVPSIGASAELLAVSAASSKEVWAVGDYSTTKQLLTLVLHWNGSSWQHVASPSDGANQPANNTRLTGVVATSRDNAWAVGTYHFNQSRGVLLHWDGSRWDLVSSPTPEVSPGPELDAIAADAGDDAWVVGRVESHNDSVNRIETLVLHCCRG